MKHFLTTLLFLILAVTFVSMDAQANCSKQKLVLPPETEKKETIAIVRVSEVNLRSGPGVRHCVYRSFGEGIKKRYVPMIGSYDTWLLVIIDGKKGWVHRAMFTPFIDL